MEPVALPETLEGERVVLKRRKLDCSQELYDLIDRNRDYIRSGFLTWIDYTNAVTDTIDFLKNNVEVWDSKENFGFNITKKKDNKIIGSISTVKLSWVDNNAEIGYWLDKSHAGKGFVTEALKILENELFKIGFHRIVITMSPLNIGSEKVATKSDYTFEGTLRNTRLVDDTYQDAHVYSKLRHEWQSE